MVCQDHVVSHGNGPHADLGVSDSQIGFLYGTLIVAYTLPFVEIATGLVFSRGSHAVPPASNVEGVGRST